MVIHAKPFLSHTGPKTTKHAEFEYICGRELKGSSALKPYVDRISGFYNRKKSHMPFTDLNTIGYKEDPYERRQDMKTLEYAKQTAKILAQDRPLVSNVR